MHELSLANAMVEQIEQALERENASKVTKICLEIGALSGVEREAFEFAFPLAIENTPLQEASLEIIEVPVKIRCKQCQEISEPELPVMICMHCHSQQYEVLQGRELSIKSMEVI